MAECSESGCERPVRVKSRGLCGMHSLRAQKAERGPCVIDGCGKPQMGAGMCSMHYSRRDRNGDPLVAQQIRLDDPARMASHLDASGGPNACHLFDGPTDQGGYCNFNLGGKTTKAHIAAWIIVNGPVPEGHDIDHECHNAARAAGVCPGGICSHRRCCNERHLAAKPRREHFDDTVPWRRTGKANLTEDRVREIKALLREGSMSGAAIARRFDLTPNTISRINTGKVWASVA